MASRATIPSQTRVRPHALLALMGLLLSLLLVAPPTSARSFADQGSSTGEGHGTARQQHDAATGRQQDAAGQEHGTAGQQHDTATRQQPATTKTTTTTTTTTAGPQSTESEQLSRVSSDLPPGGGSQGCSQCTSYPSSYMSFCMSSYISLPAPGLTWPQDCTLNVFGERDTPGVGSSEPVEQLASCMMGSACNESVHYHDLDACNKSCPGFPASADYGVCFGFCSVQSSDNMQMMFTVRLPDGRVVSNDVSAVQDVDPDVSIQMVKDRCYGGPCTSMGFVTPTPGAALRGVQVSFLARAFFLVIVLALLIV